MQEMKTAGWSRRFFWPRKCRPQVDSLSTHSRFSAHGGLKPVLQTQYKTGNPLLESPMRRFFLLFLILPVLELWLLLVVGDEIGAAATLGLLFLAAFVGLGVLRYQRRSARGRRTQREMGELPEQEMLAMMGGVMLAMGAVLLMIPGFITDALALPLLLPWSRHAIVRWLFQKGNLQAWQSGAAHAVFRARGGAGPASRSGEILEGELDDEPGSDPQQERISRK